MILPFTVLKGRASSFQHVDDLLIHVGVLDGPCCISHSITQQIELNGAVGRMIAALMLGLAEIELEFRAERQRAGIEVAKKRGVYTGRKRGTTKAKPERARELWGRGLKTKEIAEALGASQRTVQRYLREEGSISKT